MLKPLNFGQYQALKRYSFNQMNSWAVSVYKSGFEDGIESCEQDETVQMLEFDKDSLRDFLKSVNGVDDTTIDNIINAFIERGENCYAVNE